MGPRIVEASAHLTIGVAIEAKPGVIRNASVRMDIDPAMVVIPDELKGLTIVLKGERAPQMLEKIARACEVINDPTTPPEERQTLIDAIKAFAVTSDEE